MHSLVLAFAILAMGLLLLRVSVPILRTVPRTRPDGQAGGLEMTMSIVAMAGGMATVQGLMFVIGSLTLL